MLIGAVGGLCLSLLKLIEVNFLLLPSVSLVERWVGFLTYLSFIFLGSIVAIFFVDHEVSQQKQKRNALIMGLLAPSLLLAIVNEPQDGYLQDYGRITQIEEVDLVSAPLLELLPIGKAYAQGQEAGITLFEHSNDGDDLLKPAAESGNANDLIQVVTEEEVTLPIGSQFICALGRCGDTKKLPYAFVVGKAADRKLAVDAAMLMQSRIDEYEFDNEDLRGVGIEIVHPADSESYFVTFGGLRQRREAGLFQAETIKAVSRQSAGYVHDNTDPKAKLVDQLLVQGQLLPGAVLFHSVD